MSTDADAAARLLERLLADPAFRAEFRRDPVGTCRRAGLDDLAEEMSLGGGKAAHTLELRESRSGLAGVMMAAALEGVAIYQFVENVGPRLADLPDAVGDVLSRVDLPSIQGALASDAPPTPPALPPEPPPDAAAPAAAAPAAAPVPAEPPPAPEPPPEPESPADAIAPAAAPEEPAAAPEEPAAAPEEPQAAAASAEPGAPLDPKQFGAEGTGGTPTPESQALLKNENVVFDADGMKDLKAGRIDPRVASVLNKISEEHKITVSCMCSDHSKLTSGGSVSNHWYGRGVDIAAIDGKTVNASNFEARELAMELQKLDGAMRPDEVGTPWAINGPGYFTDAGHQDHLHVGFKQEISTDWKPPAGQAAAAAPAAAPAAAAVPAAGAPAAGAPAAAPPPGESLALRAVEPKAEAAAAKASDTAQLLVPEVKGAVAAEQPAAAAAPAADAAPAGPTEYPGDKAPKSQLAAWMAAEAKKRGIPGELPVMAALVESRLENVNYGHADSVGFFQMRTSIWDQGEYAGYGDKPELQMKWFLDTAERVMEQRKGRGQPIDDPQQYGEWIADVERPAEQYRGRYQLQLDAARDLLKAGGDAPAPAAAAAEPAAPQAAAAPADAAAPAPQASAEPIDAKQFGAEGTGGTPTAESEALLKNENVVFDADGVKDLKAGRIDPRVASVLGKLSEDHKITVSCMCSDHSKLTSGGSVSNHWYGRGVDIAAIDGKPVNASNVDAREIAMELQKLDGAMRPDEVGTPWAINGPGYFTDAGHQDHLHVGFKQEISADWKPPGGAAAAPAAQAAVAAPAVAAPAEAESLVLRAVKPTAEAAGSGRKDTAEILIPVKPAEAQARAAGPAGPAAAGSSKAAGPAGPAARGAAAGRSGGVAPDVAGSGGQGAGPKAQAALAEVKKHLGTPYQWGGSTPKTGFDCSGLVQWAYAQAGIKIPRVTDAQILASNGTAVERGALRAGDLVFFKDPSGRAYHVGMSLGGDRFIHAPSTGDVVKESSLKEAYFSQRFGGGRRFDQAAPAAAPAQAAAMPAAPAAPAAAPSADPAEVADARAAAARDAAEVARNDSQLFLAVKAQESVNHHNTVQFLKAIDPEEARGVAAKARAAGLEPDREAGIVQQRAEPFSFEGGGPTDYPGDKAPKSQIAAWMAAEAKKRGVPAELPVMAALVESRLSNVGYGHADSIGFFQMRTSIWDKGEYAGYGKDPDLQLKWFLDHAEQVMAQRKARGLPIDDPRHFGEWIADVERPAAQYRGRYQLQLGAARALLRGR